MQEETASDVSVTARSEFHDQSHKKFLIEEVDEVINLKGRSHVEHAIRNSEDPKRYFQVNSYTRRYAFESPHHDPNTLYLNPNLTLGTLVPNPNPRPHPHLTSPSP